ncbi:HAD family hydrolase [Roseateles sp.]|uniref:HAD family hydrolase n=1 Tax=Roseateles sp. TaxID=1971397 RepID=UPI003D0F6C4F
MGKPYSDELDGFAHTFQWAGQQPVDQLRRFLSRWSGEHVAVVGSGGSYSAALVVALFRELAHHSPTSAVTPLEFDALLQRLSPRALLLSAEGKNRDVLAAAQAAQAADLSSAALTLTTSNPLLEFAAAHASLRAFAFQMDWGKDGYLATNSLLATSTLAYRVFFGQSDFMLQLGPLFHPERLGARRKHFNSWAGLERARQSGLLVLFSAQAKPFAMDLESKFAEAALGHVQLADLRQFAHGRHLQLASQTPMAVILATSVEEAPLAAATAQLLPSTVQQWTIELDGQREQDTAIAGLIDAMFLTDAFAKAAGIDPGQPEVPAFGRAIHAIESASLLRSSPKVQSRLELAARRKEAPQVRGERAAKPGVVAAAADYADGLTRAEIKAIVCDFDGTLCRAENRFDLMAAEHAEQVSSLLRQGMVLAIATGRGNSLYDDLRKSFDPELHGAITVGYYSGSLIARLDEGFEQPPANAAFQDLLDWLQKSVYHQHCKPLSDLARGGQLSIRLDSAHECTRLLAALQHWLERNGLRGWRAFSSGHSIDILDADTSKRKVVAHIAARCQIDPNTEILRLGDAGHEGGNDYELLSEGLSLSCERVSVDLTACWNFGASGSNQVDVTSAYLRGLSRHDGAFRLLPAALFGA